MKFILNRFFGALTLSVVLFACGNGDKGKIQNDAGEGNTALSSQILSAGLKGTYKIVAESPDASDLQIIDAEVLSDAAAQEFQISVRSGRLALRAVKESCTFNIVYSITRLDATSGDLSYTASEELAGDCENYRIQEDEARKLMTNFTHAAAGQILRIKIGNSRFAFVRQ